MSHEVAIQGVSPGGVAQITPVLLQMNSEDFPARFYASLAGGAVNGSTVTALPASAASPATLYQPVQRVLHVALIQATCNTVGSPRLDPTRVDSAGVVVRRIVQQKGVNQFASPPAAWMTAADGSSQWTALDKLQESLDPDPTKRPLLQSGQPALDKLLAAQSLTGARTESWTPAFVAPPPVCDAAGRTLIYAVVPTASADVSSNAPPVTNYDPGTLASGLPALLQAGTHNAPSPGLKVDYRYLSDDYAKAHGAGGPFQTFTLTLRMLYSVFGAFDQTPLAESLITLLNSHYVYLPDGSSLPMGEFYRFASVRLIDYESPNGAPGPPVTMPQAWDAFSDSYEAALIAAMSKLLQSRSTQVSVPLGRYHDSSRLYRLRVFLRIKSSTPGCPPQLVWSQPSDPFQIAAWHQGAGRATPPVPLPDPTDRNFLKNAKPNCSFALPAGLMNAMQGSSLSGLSSGTGSSSGGLQLNWICGFNIPIITICALFILNIFLSALNIVFFWLPFVKICIPFPTPTPANSGDSDGT